MQTSRGRISDQGQNRILFIASNSKHSVMWTIKNQIRVKSVNKTKNQWTSNKSTHSQNKMLFNKSNRYKAHISMYLKIFLKRLLVTRRLRETQLISKTKIKYPRYYNHTNQHKKSMKARTIISVRTSVKMWANQWK